MSCSPYKSVQFNQREIMRNTLLLRLTLLSLLLTSVSFANESNSCRKLVVAAYKSLGEDISEDSFSSSSFEELNLSAEDFNVLSSEEQSEIYTMIKPMSVMVEETIGKLNGYINRYAGTIYEFYLVDELEAWRTYRDLLRTCSN